MQRERITAWLTAYGHHLGELFEELDQSARRGHRRPLLEQASARVESGEADGLIVWKADRFGRDLIDGLVQIRRIRDMGGVFVSVYDNLDTSTSTGRMVLRIMLSIAENRLEEISEQWRTAKAHQATPTKRAHGIDDALDAETVALRKGAWRLRASQGPEDYPALVSALRGRGYDGERLDAILSANWLRVLCAALPT